jgi:hypothetical protein
VVHAIAGRHHGRTGQPGGRGSRRTPRCLNCSPWRSSNGARPVAADRVFRKQRARWVKANREVWERHRSFTAGFSIWAIT